MRQRPSSLEELASVMENNECFKSLLTSMLGSLHNEYMEARSICLVPEQLGKSKVEAYSYRPQVVSIGPLHKGTRTDLLYMEEIKYDCMCYLFLRSKDSFPDIKNVLADCTSAMLELDESVRASYNVDKLPFNPNDLAKIMIVDGCFLLELLICGSPNLDTQLRGSSKGPSPGAGVIKREKVLSDLTLLENQIPLGVLFSLAKLLFPQLGDNGDPFQLICKLALSIMGYGYTTLRSHIRAFHFVELVYSFIDMEKYAIDNKNNDLMIDIHSGKNVNMSHQNQWRKLKLERCAARLEAAGVEIQSTGAEPESTRFNLKVTFEHGKLTIPPLHITETTQVTWRNMIAWELNKTTLVKQRGIREPEFSFQFISYAWFLQSLICCVHDVKILRDRGVIFVQHVDTEKGKKSTVSDEDLMYLFQNMTREVPGGEIDMDSWFASVIQKLNSYHPPTPIIKYATRTSKTMCHIFICWPESCWYFIKDVASKIISFFATNWELRQVGTFIALVVLLLTVAQVALAALGL
ncbi:hypothetical protein Fmac_012217 [Flemingia macrophylla]|uniref:Uncharacterized protein n=1 Tax=Flemingia macrophylla TaxID=520843 RepID=A0ABD1MQ26_9FABA